MERRAFLDNRGLVRYWPNLLAGSALFQISRDGPALVE
jgi:hypothetical protein